MTESTGPQAEPTSAAETPSRWDRRRGPHRLFALAALVVIAAGNVFIFAVIFRTGIIIGAHGGATKDTTEDMRAEARSSPRGATMVRRAARRLRRRPLLPEPACPSVVRTGALVRMADPGASIVTCCCGTWETHLDEIARNVHTACDVGDV